MSLEAPQIDRSAKETIEPMTSFQCGEAVAIVIRTSNGQI